MKTHIHIKYKSIFMLLHILYQYVIVYMYIHPIPHMFYLFKIEK